MFYILYIIDDESLDAGIGYYVRKFVRRNRELKRVNSYWIVPMEGNNLVVI